MREDRSLLRNGTKLYNRYQLGAKTAVKISSWFVLAGLLWADGKRVHRIWPCVACPASSGGGVFDF